jgi:predicted nucleic acid-binding protein
MGPIVTGHMLLDNSAWARLADPAVPADRAEEIATAIEAGQVSVSVPFLLEAGYSARNAAEHAALLAELLALPLAHIDDVVEQRALDVHRQLARVGHHRLPPVDLLLAALADRHELGILHYDTDYDIIATKTDLRFESTWLVDRGTI